MVDTITRSVRLPAVGKKKLTPTHATLTASKPKAYIEEYPISFESNDEQIFKIMLSEEGRLLCGTASYFFAKERPTVYQLDPADIVRLTMGYCRERFLTPSSS